MRGLATVAVRGLLVGAGCPFAGSWLPGAGLCSTVKLQVEEVIVLRDKGRGAGRVSHVKAR